jgi:hypothetical protein
MAFQQGAMNSYLEKIVTVKNLTDHTLNTKWDSKPYALEPGIEEHVPMWLAKHLVKTFSNINVDGKIENWVEMREGVNFSCGSCSKSFETKRELGAHSLSHRPKE